MLSALHLPRAIFGMRRRKLAGHTCPAFYFLFYCTYTIEVFAVKPVSGHGPIDRDSEQQEQQVEVAFDSEDQGEQEEHELKNQIGSLFSFCCRRFLNSGSMFLHVQEVASRRPSSPSNLSLISC